jgi:deoxyribose-phosphate aldolase
MKNIKTFLNFINEELFFRGGEPDLEKINSMVDYTLLEESATEADILELCKKADQLGVKSVCVLPRWVKTANRALRDSKVLVCTVVSFPHGDDPLIEKMQETKWVLSEGADEVDMVINYHLLQDEEEEVYDYLVGEVRALVDLCHKETNKDGDPVTLKVIVESGLLTEEETEVMSYICMDAGADFIKTSTGKVSTGAELSKIVTMYNAIKEEGSNMKIKASGGVRDMSQISQLMPYVDRFGMGYGSVDKLNNLTSGGSSTY